MPGRQPVDQERAILIARHDALDLALTIALAGYQCRIARATAVELSLNEATSFAVGCRPGCGWNCRWRSLRVIETQTMPAFARRWRPRHDHQ